MDFYLREQGLVVQHVGAVHQLLGKERDPVPIAHDALEALDGLGGRRHHLRHYLASNADEGSAAGSAITAAFACTVAILVCMGVSAAR